VIADGRSRTVFGRYCDLLFTTPQWDMPTIDRLRGARAAVVMDLETGALQRGER